MTKYCGALIVAVLSILSHSAWAGPMEALDEAMAPIAERLVLISEALSQDSQEDVAKNAEAIVRLSANISREALPGEGGDMLKGLGPAIQRGADAMAKAESIEDQREALKVLSKPIVLWASLRTPPDFKVAYCSMASASWLQDETPISNPYYGAQMLRCGQFVEATHVPK